MYLIKELKKKKLNDIFKQYVKEIEIPVINLISIQIS
jgi:hypothetical protein